MTDTDDDQTLAERISATSARHLAAIGSGDLDKANEIAAELHSLIQSNIEGSTSVDPDLPAEKPIEVRVYVETAEQAAWQGDHGPPPTPIKLAKEAMSKALRADGYALRDSSVKEVKGSRIKVATDDSEQGWHRVESNADGRSLETVTGLIVTFTGFGVPSEGDDSNVPIVTVQPDASGLLVAVLPASVTDRGGDVRVRHDLDTDEVTVRLRRRNGHGVAYIIASDLDGNVQHIVGADKGAHDVVVVPDNAMPERVAKPSRSDAADGTVEPGEPVIH